MTVRLDTFIEPVSPSQLNNRDKGVGQDTFTIKIIEVKGETVVVSVNGSHWEVKSQVALVPGQAFVVRQEQRDGEAVTWRVIKEVADSSSRAPWSILERLGLPECPENNSIIYALSKSGLPITEENLRQIRRLMEKLGGFTSTNLMTAITSIKLGISSEPLLQILASFFENLVTPRPSRKDTPGSISNDQRKVPWQGGEDNRPAMVGFRLKAAVDTLRELLHIFLNKSCHDLEGELQRLCGGDRYERNLLLGGQFFACAQGNVKEQKPFYYIPLFAFFNGEDFPKGEIFIYPESPEQKGATSALFLLNLATRHLGWIQVELNLRDNLLKIRMLVEEQATKLLIDKFWPQLADALKEIKYRLLWSGCKVGSIKTTIRDLQKGCFDGNVHKTLDITV